MSAYYCAGFWHGHEYKGQLGESAHIHYSTQNIPDELVILDPVLTAGGCSYHDPVGAVTIAVIILDQVVVTVGQQLYPVKSVGPDIVAYYLALHEPLGCLYAGVCADLDMVVSNNMIMMARAGAEVDAVNTAALNVIIVNLEREALV